MNLSLKTLLLFGVIAEVLIYAVSFSLHPSLEESFRFAARYSGRLSAGVFLWAFWQFSWSFPLPVRGNKRLQNALTLFAVLHLIHFGFLATNVFLNDIALIPVKLTGGALAYLMIVAAPFVLSKLKRVFQLIYFYYVTLVMSVTYVARLNGDFEGAEPFWLHYVMLGVFVAAAFLFGGRMMWQRRDLKDQ